MPHCRTAADAINLTFGAAKLSDPRGLLVVEDDAIQKQELDDTIRLLEGTALAGFLLSKSDACQQHTYN
jgi:hypothetical protein